MNGKIALRIVSALVLIAAIAGIAFFAYSAGVAHASPVTLSAAPNEQAAPASYYYGYLGLLIPLFLVVLAFRAFHFMVWGPRFGFIHGLMMHRRWGENGVPPMFEEWHKRMHGEQPGDKKE